MSVLLPWPGEGARESVMTDMEAVEALKHDPMKFKELCWPDVRFYEKQRQIVYSFRDNDETIVPAGNKLGKDFVAAFLVVWFFMTRHPCRIVTTSAKDQHLAVLWGEIMNFINTSRIPLNAKAGGPLVCTHQNIKKLINGRLCDLSYVKGMVTGPHNTESLQGHHIAQQNDGIPRTAMFVDESSASPEEADTMTKSWRNRFFGFGNTWACDNWFRHAIEGAPDRRDPGGDIVDPLDPKRYERRVIHITAMDSPNVILGLKEREMGRAPSYRMVIPGVKSMKEYDKERRRLSESEACVILDAKFWKGKDAMLYPAEWLLRARKIAAELEGTFRRAKGMGVDPAEGGDKSAWTIVDEFGVIYQESRKTPRTTDVVKVTLELMSRFQVPPDRVYFDNGGGGKQHADVLRDQGFTVKSLGFGTPPMLEVRYARYSVKTRKDMVEIKYAYRNRRAQMYHLLRQLIDPDLNPDGFGIPDKYWECHRQLGPIPLWHDEEGRIYLPPKHKDSGQKSPTKDGTTLEKLLGCSPDEADSLVLAVYGMLEQDNKVRAGAA